MNILDDQKVLKKSDQSKVATSISLFSRQMMEAWEGISEVKIPTSYLKHQNIVFCGMGGSNLSSELVRYVFGSEIKKPFVLVRDYNLPQFVNRDTLVIVSSYSGNTEETVSCLKQAITRKAKIFCLSSGGQIVSLAKKNKLPYYKLGTKFNPSGQPRYGLGYQIGAALGLFSNLKTIKLNSKQVGEIAEYINILNSYFGMEVPQSANPAKNMADKFKNTFPVLIAADFLSANVHILSNQINESAKNLSMWHLIPELNHHLMEGFNSPEVVKNKIKFLFFNSDQYSDDIAKRFMVTQKVLKKQGLQFAEYFLEGDNKLMISLEILFFGSWFSFYLAVLNGEDPAGIPWVDLFKKEMKK